MSHKDGGIMQLQKIGLKDYGRIKDLTLEPEGSSLVLFGTNGVGKSTILRAINTLFVSVLSKLTNSRIPPAFSEVNDIRYGADVATGTGELLFDSGEVFSTFFIIKREKKQRLTNSKKVEQFCALFESLYGSGLYPMPIFASYGVNRAVLDIPVRIRSKHNFDRLEAYFNAVSGNTTDFRTFFEWFRSQEEYENSEKVLRRDFEYSDPALAAVRKAIESMLPGLTNIHIEHAPLHLSATKDGVPLHMEQLSDGEKCLLAMLGDIARRLAIANPEHPAPLQCGGIVLIDEIELHMHPEWQRKVLRILHQTFPNIQFIVTTHSPQVIGELPPGFKLFCLEKDNDGVVATPVTPALYDSNYVLEELMQVASVNSEVENLSHAAFVAIEHKDFELAEQLIGQLRQITNGSATDITQAEVLLGLAKRGAAQ